MYLGSPMTIGSGGSSRGSFSPPGTAASGKNCTYNQIEDSIHTF